MNTQEDQRTDHLTKRVLGRIESEHLVPRSRAEFIFKNYFFWTLGALAVALGAFAFAATLFEITNVDWRLSPATHPNFFAFFFAAAPFLWIVILTIFIIIGYINIRRTNHGYRYSLAIIALGAVLTSLTLGTGLYAVGLGGGIEEAIGDHPPFYRPIILTERSWWLTPAKGLLGGQVASVATNATSFTLRDFSGRVWDVDGSDLHNPDLATVARGGIVRVVGVPVTAMSSVFHACFVFPWETRGSSFGAPLPPPLATLASTSGKGATATDSDMCKNIRPYRQLRNIDNPGL